MTKIRNLSVALFFVSIIFSFLSIHFALDVSFFAFPLSAVFSLITAFFLYFKVYKTKDLKAVSVSVKLLQYLPFVLFAAFILRRTGKNGTSYAYDVITVLLWCASFILCQILLYFFNEKRIALVNPEWKNKFSKSSGIIATKKITKKTVFFEAVDWIDSIVQAVFMVLLVQIFIFQLYIIPSESMVPAFLIKDRVVVFKTASGPKFPLSDVGLPCLKTYKRGDVVVFRNPHYSLDRKSEVRSVISQIVYMLTFTAVNLNVDEHGELKADPLVKRICGLPGEQLVMQDGVLYARTSSDDSFKAVDFDSKFAAWNLNDLPDSVKKGIQIIPLPKKYYEVMLEVEASRRELDVNALVSDTNMILKNALAYYDAIIKEKKVDTPSGTYNFVNSVDFLLSDTRTFTQNLLRFENGRTWFKDFIQSGIDSVPSSFAEFNGDVYKEANFRLNLMIKNAFAHLVAENLEFIRYNVSLEEQMKDSHYVYYLSEAQKLGFYVNILDQRNMPVFPANKDDGTPSYIPQNSYFMMGDNRFNSLDMRHSYEQHTALLYENDKNSVTYYSDMEPRYVNRKLILGTAVFRFWPKGRIGGIKTK